MKPASQAADKQEELSRAYELIWNAPAEHIPMPRTPVQRLAEVFPHPARANRGEKIFVYTPSPLAQLTDQMLGSKRRVWDFSRSPITYEKLRPQFGLPPLTREETQALRLFDGCLIKTLTGALSGAGLGTFMALLFLGVDPAWTRPSSSTTPLTTAQVLRRMLSRKSLVHTSRRVLDYAGGFAAFAASYAAIECLLESWRAKSDWKNAVCTGSIVGFTYGARRGSIKSGATNGLLFGMFSLAIDLYQRGAFTINWRGRQQLDEDDTSEMKTNVPTSLDK